MDKKIKDMPTPGEGYVVPWAFSARVEGLVVHVDYPYDEEPEEAIESVLLSRADDGSFHVSKDSLFLMRFHSMDYEHPVFLSE